jgi:LPXTG-motif cell wall-anchored protein
MVGRTSLCGAAQTTLAAGAHQVTFAPLPAPSPAARAGASVRGSQLPATGAPEAVLAAGGLVALLGALGLRRLVARAVVRR